MSKGCRCETAESVAYKADPSDVSERERYVLKVTEDVRAVVATGASSLATASGKYSVPRSA